MYIQGNDEKDSNIILLCNIIFKELHKQKWDKKPKDEQLV